MISASYIYWEGHKNCRKEKFAFDERLIEDYGEDSDKGYILEIDVKYPKELHDLHSDLLFLPKRMKVDNCEKLVCNLCDEENYVICKNALRQALDHRLKKD